MTKEISLLNDEEGFFCNYAGKILLPLLQTLDHELSGVLSSKDIEPIHQCRVASRRIRATLPIFSLCFSKKKVVQWKREIRTLTQALGNARDLDVQIEFIRLCIAENTPNSPLPDPLFNTPDEYQTPSRNYDLTIFPTSPNHTGLLSIKSRLVHVISNLIYPARKQQEEVRKISFEQAKKNQIGLECLLLRLEQKRANVQEQVTKAVHQIHMSNVIPRMRREIQICKFDDTILRKQNNRAFACESAFIHIIGKITELTWFEPYLLDPSAHTKHHEMRIAAKRLRYTLETFSGLFSDKLKSEITVVKKIQEILGDIHDCDVWVDYLPVFLEEEKNLSINYSGNIRLFDLIEPGILNLKYDRSTNRDLLFQKFVETYQEYK